MLFYVSTLLEILDMEKSIKVSVEGFEIVSTLLEILGYA